MVLFLHNQADTYQYAHILHQDLQENLIIVAFSPYRMNKFQEGLQAQRKLVEQLRAEAAIQRLPVSECVEEIKKFCEQHEENDVLIKGFVKQNDNPFKEKGGCTIL